jgi:hypothetical protein
MALLKSELRNGSSGSVSGRAALSAGDPEKHEVGARAADQIRRVSHVLSEGEWWSDGGSNPGPSACHADALPTELSPRVRGPES